MGIDLGSLGCSEGFFLRRSGGRLGGGGEEREEGGREERMAVTGARLCAAALGLRGSPLANASEP